jgi:hypothetical protein
MTDRAELRRLAEAVQQGDNPAALSSRMAFVSAASPDVFLGLLEEIERLTGECDFFSVRSEEERTNRGLAEKDFHNAMELVRKYSAERDQLRAVAVRLRDAIKDAEHDIREVCGFLPSNDEGCDRFKQKAKDLCETLADPEVEKL